MGEWGGVAESVTLFGPPKTVRVKDYRVEPTKDCLLVHRLNRLWHSTLPFSPPGERVMFMIYAPNLEIVAVAIWGRPSARSEDQETTLQLSRLAHGPLAPYNLGSYGLARMRKWIRENMPEIIRVISYQNADEHDGAIYKADNWRMVYEKFTEGSWQKCRPGRRDSEVQHKIKWEREP